MAKASFTKSQTLALVRQHDGEIINTTALPPLDAPAISTSDPERSYKIDFSDRSVWFYSEDGGETKHRHEWNAVAGAVVDLQLQISEAKFRDGLDYRLRLAFAEPDGTLSELNLNAINIDPSGNAYVTSPARSLTGALLAISESEDDMHALTSAARFTIRPGRGKGVFVNADLASNGQWIGMASPGNTNRVPRDADGFVATIALIKSRFRGLNLLMTAAAVSGLQDDSLDAVDAEATQI